MRFGGEPAEFFPPGEAPPSRVFEKAWLDGFDVQVFEVYADGPVFAKASFNQWLSRPRSEYVPIGAAA